MHSRRLHFLRGFLFYFFRRVSETRVFMRRVQESAFYPPSEMQIIITKFGATLT